LVCKLHKAGGDGRVLQLPRLAERPTNPVVSIEVLKKCDFDFANNGRRHKPSNKLKLMSDGTIVPPLLTKIFGAKIGIYRLIDGLLGNVSTIVPTSAFINRHRNVSPPEE
jgi:hypothetical protein